MIGHIFKYELPLIGEIMELKLPEGMAVCEVHHQENKIYLWGMVDIHAPLETRQFVIFGTGWQIQNVSEMFYLKTVFMPDGLVWHIFEVSE